MVRILQAVSALALISAGVVFLLCVANWLQDTPGIEQNQELSIAEKVKKAGSSRKSSEKTISPLVKQAEAFALYLNPPKSSKPIQMQDSTSNSKPNTPVVKLPKTIPKFTLLATSYYRARPDESLALVSEPGREPRWVNQGTHLGHFVVERIKPKMIVYREGDRLGEMAMNTKAPIYIEPAAQTTFASDQAGSARPKPSSPDKPKKTRPRSPMHKLGPPRPETQVVAYNQRIASG
jgi:hypothetical protein